MRVKVACSNSVLPIFLEVLMHEFCKYGLIFIHMLLQSGFVTLVRGQCRTIC